MTVRLVRSPYGLITARLWSVMVENPSNSWLLLVSGFGVLPLVSLWSPSGEIEHLEFPRASLGSAARLPKMQFKFSKAGSSYGKLSLCEKERLALSFGEVSCHGVTHEEIHFIFKV
jgi:hypothetical protein